MLEATVSVTLKGGIPGATGIEEQEEKNLGAW